MLRGLQLENFKAFGAATAIEFAPITLIFGENSAGKSSILQSLNLLKQTRESRERDALLLPRTEGGLVDLGSFQELLFDHDLKRHLRLRLEFERTGETGEGSWFWRRRLGMPEVTSVSVEMAFYRPSRQEEVSLSYLAVFLENVKEPIARFEPVKVTAEMRRAL